MKDFTVGDIVYPCGSPLRLGRILEIRSKTRLVSGMTPFTHTELLIQWFKRDQIAWASSLGIRRLEDLIADHEKKLKGHRARLLAAEDM